jgi:hypothetical protein
MATNVNTLQTNLNTLKSALQTAKTGATLSDFTFTGSPVQQGVEDWRLRVDAVIALINAAINTGGVLEQLTTQGSNINTDITDVTTAFTAANVSSAVDLFLDDSCFHASKL